MQKQDFSCFCITLFLRYLYTNFNIMYDYYVNDRAQANGDHEVHKEGCIYMPSSKTYLGKHASCASAVAAAKKIYSKSNGCRTCSTACHTS